MIEKYLNEQFLVTTLLKNALKNNKIVQAYMFSSNDMNYIFNYAKDFAKDLVSSGMSLDNIKNISNKIDNDIYDELKIIEPINDIIKKEQILNLKNETKTKPIEGNKIVYIIKNCEKLSKITANAMLKFIEDAEDDVVAIFLTDNIDMVIPTIKSRCQILNFKKIDEFNNFTEFLCNQSLNNDIELIEKIINCSINYIKEIERVKINTYFKLKQLVYDVCIDSITLNIFLTSLLYFYYDSLNYNILKKIKYLKEYEENVKYICECNTLDQIIAKIYIIEQVKNDNLYNLNKNLLIDRLTLELSEV